MDVGTKSNGKLVGIVAFALVGILALAACSNGSAETEGASMDNGGNASAMGTTSTNASDSAYRKITASEAQGMMDSQEVTIVDVRTAQEYAEGHIPGAINIPVESIGDAKPSELSDTNAELVVYCRTGVRSKQASDKLVALGYAHVNDMGGIVDWTGETVTGNQPR